MFLIVFNCILLINIYFHSSIAIEYDVLLNFGFKIIMFLKICSEKERKKKDKVIIMRWHIIQLSSLIFRTIEFKQLNCLPQDGRISSLFYVFESLHKKTTYCLQYDIDKY